MSDDRKPSKCVDCGAPTGRTYCNPCGHKHVAAKARERARAQREWVEGKWAEGWTGNAIVAHLGLKMSGNSYIAINRSRGYDLPYRRSAEVRANIREGLAQVGNARMEKARAAR